LSGWPTAKPTPPTDYRELERKRAKPAQQLENRLRAKFVRQIIHAIYSGSAVPELPSWLSDSLCDEVRRVGGPMIWARSNHAVQVALSKVAKKANPKSRSKQRRRRNGHLLSKTGFGTSYPADYPLLQAA
jgi:hypothetical protein